MIVQSLALLLGLFGVPVLLMVMGHRLRGRSRAHKRRFWGGAFGYVVGILIAVSAMLLPPVYWGSEEFLRSLLVHWSMLGGGLMGVLSGPLWARVPRATR